jgi:hypothetical protein
MALDIRAIEAPEFSFPQAESDALPSLPCRLLALGNSGSGKSTALIQMITQPRFYGKKQWERVYWCSPTAAVDDAMAPLRRYVEDVLKQDQEEDPTFHDHIDVPFLTKVIERQRRITERMKSMTPRPKKGFGILIVLDDLADSRRNALQCGQLVDSLFIKARHWGVSTILSTQKLRLPLISPRCRVNVTGVMTWRLRSAYGKTQYLEEYAALGPKAVLETMYDEATSIRFNFLYINTLAKDIDHMFYSGFTRRFIPSEMME